MMNVADIAARFNVSKVVIYKRINDTMKAELEPFVVKKDNVKYILPEGIQLIEKSLAEYIPKNEAEDKLKDDTKNDHKNIDIERLVEHYNGLINTLKEQIKEKDKQIEKKDRQLDRKDDLLEKNNDLLQNFQVIVRQNQERLQELEGNKA